MTAVYIAPWRIDVTIRDTVDRPIPVSQARLARAMASALDVAGASAPARVGLILADDEELAGLNETHLGHEGATDVLSFPLLPPEAYPAHDGDPDRGPKPRIGDAAHFVGPPGRRAHLGDIVVSVERARAQSEEGRGGQTGDIRWSVADELRLLVIHGTLHVCGWDHADPAEEAAMRVLERHLLAVG